VNFHQGRDRHSFTKIPTHGFWGEIRARPLYHRGKERKKKEATPGDVGTGGGVGKGGRKEREGVPLFYLSPFYPKRGGKREKERGGVEVIWELSRRRRGGTYDHYTK